MRAQGKALVFVDPIAGGHHGTYLAWLIEGALAAGYTPHVLTTAAARASRDFSMNISCEINCILGPPLDTELRKGSFVANSHALRLRSALWLKKALTAVPADAELFFPYLDLFASQIAIVPGLLATHTWSGISMAFSGMPGWRDQHISVKARQWLKAAIISRVASNQKLKRLFSLDPFIKSDAVSGARATISKITYLPDPAKAYGSINRSDARQRLGIQGDPLVLLCYGRIDERKGVETVLKAALGLTSADNIVIIIAGAISSPISKSLNETAIKAAIIERRVLIIDKFITHEEEALVFSACDFCWLGYKGFLQMSGTFTRAMAYKRPVIACSEGLIGWHTTKFGVGVILPDVSVQHVIDTLAMLRDSDDLLADLSASAAKASTEFSVENAKNIIFATDGIAAR